MNITQTIQTIQNDFFITSTFSTVTEFFNAIKSTIEIKSKKEDNLSECDFEEEINSSDRYQSILKLDYIK